MKVIARLKSVFWSNDTKDKKWFNKINSYMEYVVELPSGQRVFMNQKEVNEFNKTKTNE